MRPVRVAATATDLSGMHRWPSERLGKEEQGMEAHEPVTMLLGDDQPGKLLSYAAILADLGGHLLRAGSAREALAHLLRTEIAVILMDVQRPEMNGFALATMIRQHPRSQQTAIMFLSGVSLTDLAILKGYDSGAVDDLTVPVVPAL